MLYINPEAVNSFKTEFVIGSAIDAEMYELNTRLLQDEQIAAELNHRYTRFGENANEYQAAIGIFNPDGQLFQLKRQHPRTNREGKPIKYETPKGQSTLVFTPQLTDGLIKDLEEKYNVKLDSSNLWDSIAANHHIPLFITEGGKKALSLCSSGRLAVGLAGIFNAYTGKTVFRPGKPLKELKDFMQKLANGRNVTIAFDQDSKQKTRDNVAKAIDCLAQSIIAAGGNVDVMTWQPEAGKGIDDLIVAGNIDQAVYRKYTEPLHKGYKRLLVYPRHVVESAGYAVNDAIKQPTAATFTKLDDYKSILNKELLTSKFILDNSGTGSGKSFNAAKLQPDQLHTASKLIKRLITVTDNYRNPTVDELANWQRLEGRHGGLVYNNKRIVAKCADNNSTIEVNPNCARPDTIMQMYNYRLPTSEACKSCPYLEACGAGQQYGYIHDKNKTIETAKRIICNGGSLAAFEDLQNTGIIIDEISSLHITESLTVSKAEIEAYYAKLLIANDINPDNNAYARQLVKCLLVAMNRKDLGRYGLSGEDAHNILPIANDYQQPQEDNLVAILGNDIAAQFHNHGNDVSSLRPQDRKMVAPTDAQCSNNIKHNLSSQAVIDLIMHLYSGNCALSVTAEGIQATIKNQQLLSQLRAAAFVLILDATATKEQVAQLIQEPADSVAVIKCEQAQGATVNIYQIPTFGRNSKNRGDDQQKRMSALKNSFLEQLPNSTVADYASHNKGLEGCIDFFRNSRGSNEYTKTNNLLIAGIPTINLGSLIREFELLYGHSPSLKQKPSATQIRLTDAEAVGYALENVYEDEQLQAFIKGKRQAELQQTIGRLRAERRPGEVLNVYIATDEDIGLPCTIISPGQFTIEALPKPARKRLAISEAIQTLGRLGHKVTQAAIAAYLKVCQSTISRHLKLIVNSIINDDLEPEVMPDENAIDAGRQSIDSLIDAANNITEAVGQIVTTFVAQPVDAVIVALARASHAYRRRAVMAMLTLLGLDESMFKKMLNYKHNQHTIDPLLI